jgi:hypothetical protein
LMLWTTDSASSMLTDPGTKSTTSKTEPALTDADFTSSCDTLVNRLIRLSTAVATNSLVSLVDIALASPSKTTPMRNVGTLALGDAVGDAVGIVVGTLVVAAVGIIASGERVDVVVGDAVGTAVGVVVGAVDGVAVGMVVGAAVGTVVGDADVVGADEGGDTHAPQ